MDRSSCSRSRDRSRPSRSFAISSTGSVSTKPRRRDLRAILGLDLESIPLAIDASVVSLLLAFLVWTRPAWRWPVVITAALMFGFLVLDIREIAHQVDESRTSVAISATAVALLHGAAVLAAVLLFARREPSVGDAPAPPAAA